LPRGSIAVNLVTKALNDVIFIEEITSSTPFWAVLAIGLAGRLASDFGAQVIRLRDGADPLCDTSAGPSSPAQAVHLRALQSFLCHGKENVDRPAHEGRAAGDHGKTHLRLRYSGDPDIPDQAEPWPAARRGKQVIFAEEVSGGHTARNAASEFTIAARGGLLDIVGRSDARPLMLGGHQISYATGLSGFLAAVGLLHASDLDRAEVSALGTALWINWKSLAAAAQGRPIPRRSAENGKWRTAPCADGHVALVYFDRDWPVIGKMTGDPAMLALSAERGWTVTDKLDALERGLEAWALRHSRNQIANASKTFGLAFGPVWTPAELLDDPQYRARHFFSEPGGIAAGERVRPRLPVVAAAQGEAAAARPRPDTLSARRGPLAGVRVIDLGILTAGASTSAILADLGADVIKVESPTYLDPFRGTPGTSRAEGWWNNSDAFKSTNRNKRGICLDLKSPRGRELFLQLAGQSDVVIENFRRGVMQRLGIGYDALRSFNPAIILASVSSQGESGPDAGNISFGSTLEATSGLAALTAYDDGVPLVTGMDLNYPDQVGSVFAAAAIVTALRATALSRAGAHLDISQRELATYLLGEAVMAEDDGILARLGNASPEYLLQDTFATRDGWVAVSIKDDQELVRALTFAAPAVARANSRDIVACKDALSVWISGAESREVCHILSECGIAAAPVFDGQDAWDYAQRAAAGAIRPLARSPSGDVVKGFPLHLPERPIAVTLAAPDLGQHTEEVLRDVLGVSPEDIEALTQDHVIGTRPASPNASRLD
jgi:crotonobetainyl-CoA:carnitine CoA-transferase CaiB-like acyl-CoA transferase